MGLSRGGNTEGEKQGYGIVGVAIKAKAGRVIASGKPHFGKRKESLFLQHKTVLLPIYLTVPAHCCVT